MSHEQHQKYFGGWILTTIILIITLVVLGLIIVPPLITNATTSDDEIVIGALLPLSGDSRDHGISLKEGIELALDEINNNGHNIRVEVRDTESKGTTALEKYFELYDQGVRVFIGPIDSDVTEAVAPFAEIYKTPLITFGTSTNLAEFTNYIFKISPSDKYLSSKVATEMTASVLENNPDKTAKLAVVWAQNSFARSFYENVEKYANSVPVHEEDEEGHKSIEVISIPITSINSAVNKLAETNPDEILVIPESPKQLSDLLTAIYDANICQNCSIAATDTGFGDEVINNPASYGVSVISPKTFTNQNFLNKYKDKYDSIPDMFTANGYDAMNTLTSVIYTRGSDPEDVTEGLKNYRGEGVNGQIYFNPETLTRYPVYEIYTSFMGKWYIQDIFNYFNSVPLEKRKQLTEYLRELQEALVDGDLARTEIAADKVRSIVDMGAFTRYAK